MWWQGQIYDLTFVMYPDNNPGLNQAVINKNSTSSVNATFRVNLEELLGNVTALL